MRRKSLFTSKKSAHVVKILKLSSKDISRHLQIDQLLYSALDTEFFTEILKQLLVENNRVKEKMQKLLLEQCIYL